MNPVKLLLTVLFLALSSIALGAGVGRPPNIVLLIGDDQGWGDYGFMGHPDIRTPNLDQLAQQGQVFRHGYVPTALCRPSLASLMTGLYPHQHGLTGNKVGGKDREQVQRGEEALAREFVRLPRLAALLGEAGYSSFQGGKWWEGEYSSGGFSQGVGNAQSSAIGRETLQPVFDFIDGAGERPYLLWYAPFLPHFPHDPPQRLLQTYLDRGLHPELAKYYAMCEWSDESIGKLRQYIEDSGQADNTVFVYLADNGWVQPTAPVAGQPWYFGAPLGKGSAYENGVRTPIILHWEGRLPAVEVLTPVSTIDLMPTLLQLAGQPVPNQLPGLDLADREALASRQAVYGATFKHTMRPRTSPAGNVINRWLVSGRWKLIANEAVAGAELYDLAEDPGEHRNLAASERELTERLHGLLDQWWLPTPETSKRGSGKRPR